MVILKKILKYISITVLSILAIFILFLAGLKIFLPDNYLPNMVSKYATENLNATVKIEEINLTAFKHFPFVGIELKEGTIISHNAPKQMDSLLAFKNFTLLFNPLGIAGGKVNIKRILLTSPKIYAYVGPDNTPSWDIFKQTDSVGTPKADTTSSEIDFNININHVAIKDKGIVVYRNRADSLLAMLSLNSVVLKGAFTNKLENLRIQYGNFSRVTAMAMHKTSSARFSIDTLNVESYEKGVFDIIAHTRTNVHIAKTQMAKNIPLDITGKIKINRKNILGIENFKISTAKIPILINGDILFTPDSIYTNNLTAQIEEFPFSDFLDYIPQKVFENIDKVKTSAKLSMDSKFKGSYNFKTGKLPDIDVHINIPNSNIKIQGSKLGIKDMAAQLNYYCRPNTPDSNRLEIKKLMLDGDGILLSCTGYAKNITQDPYIKVKLNSFVSLDTLANILPNSTGIIANGEINANLNIEGKRSQINLYNLKNTNIKGELLANNVLVRMPEHNILCSILGSKCIISSKESGVVFTVDSTNINIADSIVIEGKNILFSGENVTTKDNKSKGKIVHPFNGIAQAEHLRLDSNIDSLKLRVRDLKGTFSLMAHNDDYSTPHLKGGYSSSHIFFKHDVNIITIANSYINVDAFRNTKQIREREIRENNLKDSLQRVYPLIPRDSLIPLYFSSLPKRTNRASDDFAQLDYNFRLADKGLINILNRWTTAGSINAKRIRIATPYFPLRNSLSNANIEFDLNKLKINSADFALGHSKFYAEGSLSGIKSALTRGGRLKASLNINADTLNFNELLRAASAGGEYISKGEQYKESLRNVSDQEQMMDIVATENADSLGKLDLIIVPKNIETNFNLNIRHGVYSSLILKGARGSLNSAERKLHIKDFTATTSAGEININAFYATPSKKDLSAGFDLILKDINIGSFVELVPDIDSILPMLKSFEGIINCRIAATTQIDTNMNIVFPTLKGVAKIQGDSLILMDGETFATIAKKLKFKNRERNLVDKIAVEALMDNNTIEVFPFLADIDRYKIAISGSQDIDLNFKYHFSVIKSPIPIRFGVNVFGNMDDFDFKIGKALYKNVNLPVYTHIIDSTTVNLRNYINNILQKGVDAALQGGSHTKRLRELVAKDTINILQMEDLSVEDSLKLAQ